jgi:hypothetical protein
MKSFAGILLFSLIFVSCRSSLEDRHEASKSLSIPPAGLPPDVCRIIGTVVRIDSTFKSASPDDPCSKAPCEAMVRIDSVLGYGSSFPIILSTGTVIRTHFTLTLAPTEQVLPKVKPSYPGVGAGSWIRADLKSLPVLGSTRDNATTFTVDWYELR